MRILVLGATGHLGQAIVRRALEHGHEVTAATRQAKPVALRGLPVTIVSLDSQWSTLPAIARGHHVIIDAAAPYPLDPCPPFSPAWTRAMDTAVQHVCRLVEATRSAGAKLVYISSFTTLRRDHPSFMDAHAAWRRSVVPYFAAKQRMEEMILEAARSGLPIVVINPAACLGPWEFRSPDSSFVSLVLRGQLPVVMDRVLSVIDVRDVAMAVEAALDREMFGCPIALAGHNIHLAELARQILDAAGIHGRGPAVVDAQTASIAALTIAAGFSAFNLAAPELWRAVPLIADSFPMYLSAAQQAIGLALRPLHVTIRDSVVFHVGARCC